MAVISILGVRTTACVILLTAMAVATSMSPASSVNTARRHVTMARNAPLVTAAGDIACGPNVAAYNGGRGTSTQCRQRYTARLLEGSDAVWTLGDHAYPAATMDSLRTAYSPTWGRFRSVTYPTPGDHDYEHASGRDYYAYFDRRPYYSFRIGGWRVFSLNSEINHSARSRQHRWLDRKLSAVKARCIAAYWSTPRWTSGPEAPGDASFRPFWRSLYAARADLVLSGDTHNYERFALQTPRGERSPKGVRQFVVGTGGRSLYEFSDAQENSQARKLSFGVLRLRLHRNRYEWRFLNEARRTLDSGSKRCH